MPGIAGIAGMPGIAGAAGISCIPGIADVSCAIAAESVIPFMSCMPLVSRTVESAAALGCAPCGSAFGGASAGAFVLCFPAARAGRAAGFGFAVFFGTAGSFIPGIPGMGRRVVSCCAATRSGDDTPASVATSATSEPRSASR